MKKPEVLEGWAVYHIAASKSAPAGRAVCLQREWPAIQERGGGRCTLIQGFIANEAEAERLARGTAGDAMPRVDPARYSPVIPQE